MVDERKITISDVLIAAERIECISTSISSNNANILDAKSLYLIMGTIDDQVPFRVGGLIYEADIFSESKAAVLGGITSYMDLSNTIPNILTQELLDEKFAIAILQFGEYRFYVISKFSE
jgi:dihydroorotase